MKNAEKQDYGVDALDQNFEKKTNIKIFRSL